MTGMESRLRLAAAVVGLAALTFAPCASPAQVRKTKDGYLLRMKWTEGAVYSYDISITTELSPGQTLPINTKSSMKVLSVSDGVATVELTSPDLTSGEMVKQTLEADGLGFMGVDGAAGAAGGPKLPKKAVRPGDSWTSETSGDIMGMSVTTTTVYTFSGLELVGDVPCVVLTLKTTASTQMLSVNGVGTTYVETRNGQVYKSELNNVISIKSGGQTLTFPNKVVVVRT